MVVGHLPYAILWLGGYSFGWDVVQDKQGGCRDRGECVRLPLWLAMTPPRAWLRPLWVGSKQVQ